MIIGVDDAALVEIDLDSEDVAWSMSAHSVAPYRVDGCSALRPTLQGRRRVTSLFTKDRVETRSFYITRNH